MPEFTISYPIRRNNLEYPTEDVSLVYLTAIDKMKDMPTPWAPDFVICTLDSFTDKAIEHLLSDKGMWGCARYLDDEHFYWHEIRSQYTTEDYFIKKRVAGTSSSLATESVDLDIGYIKLGKLSVSGSTIKGYREDLETPKLTVTDTDIASGGFGIGLTIEPSDNNPRSSTVMWGYLRAPSSIAPKAKAIIEIDITGKGTREDPIRPNLLQQLSQDKTKNLLSVSWGAFDFKVKSSTMLIMVYGDNSYQTGAIQKQIDYAKSKGYLATTPPKTPSDIIALYKKLQYEHKNWLAGKDNFLYQVTGEEIFELFAVVDFYFGELIEHKTHYRQLKKVPDWELRRLLENYMNKLKKVTVLTDERNKHLDKLIKIKKLGW
ncbi:MAG: hypothetical protein DRO23_07020 [Thermoprotei archaeon]|nr:MAG: hypothetical protein DRO23_07020 [Thermoprotei archaeon]